MVSNGIATLASELDAAAVQASVKLCAMTRSGARIAPSRLNTHAAALPLRRRFLTCRWSKHSFLSLNRCGMVVSFGPVLPIYQNLTPRVYQNEARGSSETPFSPTIHVCVVAPSYPSCPRDLREMVPTRSRAASTRAPRGAAAPAPTNTPCSLTFLLRSLRRFVPTLLHATDPR